MLQNYEAHDTNLWRLEPSCLSHYERCYDLSSLPRTGNDGSMQSKKTAEFFLVFFFANSLLLCSIIDQTGSDSLADVLKEYEIFLERMLDTRFSQHIFRVT